MSRFIDLSHAVEEGMETYRPLPTPRVEILNDYDAARYDGKSEFLIASLHLCGNTGTYVDSPRHRFRAGVDLAGLSLESLADLPVVVADATGAGRAISPDSIPTTDLRGKGLLVRTDFEALAHRELLQRESIFDCRRLPRDSRGRGRLCRDRLIEHRRHC